ncbi:MAG: hypothetical protein U0133_11995 [Gemmatimonadales bacterium]
MLLLLTALAVQAPDTTPYRNEATRAVVARAMERHGTEDSELKDYLARFRYRITFGLGRRRWANVPNAAVEEQEGTVHWAAPNDVKVDIQGRRQQARSRDLTLSSNFDRPWFIPRSLGDSIRVFGNDVPRRAALHPLAPDGPAWYRYRLTDSLQIVSREGRRLKLYTIEVTPTRSGASLVAGRLWIEAERGDLVRIAFRFVGTSLWIAPDEDTAGDSAQARKLNRIANRVLTLDADLEYALQEGKYWMPYRQTVAGKVELPWFGELVIPFEARTTFEEYTVNTGIPIAFSIPLPDSVSGDSARALMRIRRDSIRTDRRRRRDEGGELPEDSLARDEAGRWADGRYEIHRPPADSLKAYRGWQDSLVLSDDPVEDRQVLDIQSDLERMTAKLPTDITGRRTHGFTWERILEAIRYNRVQGFVPGLGYEVTLPGDGFTTLRGEARFGLSDERVVGGLTLQREAPGARWTLRGYREVRTNDPFSRGNRIGNSFNAIFAGHDDADYLLSHGAWLTREGSLGTGLELTTSLFVDHETSVAREARSWLNDALGGTGRFPRNPAVREGTYGGGLLKLEGLQGRTRWSFSADVLANDARGTGRAWVYASHPLWGGRRAPTLAVRAGVATADPLPQQLFRLGGTGTVRGFDYGTRAGRGFWAAQLDWPLMRGLVQPVLFADAGQAGNLGRGAAFGPSSVIAGGGAGLSLLGGILRFDLSHPITKGGDGLRFDITMRALVWPQ